MASPLKAGFHRLEIQKTTWDVPDRYTSLNSVGSGAYGTVCSAIDQKTKEKVAIKKLYRPFQSLIHAKRAYRELRLLRHIQHDNVICLLNVFTPDSSLDKFQTFYLVMPFVAQDLGHIMKKRRLTEKVIVYLFYQLLRGLKVWTLLFIFFPSNIHYRTGTSTIYMFDFAKGTFMHYGIQDCFEKSVHKVVTKTFLCSISILLGSSIGYVCTSHPDLKPNNLAVDENCELKILDFGLARHAEMEMTGYVVTRWYRAPEVIFNWMHYTQTVDIWSAGCILAEMITGQVLFPGNDTNPSLTPFQRHGPTEYDPRSDRNPTLIPAAENAEQRCKVICTVSPSPEKERLPESLFSNGSLGLRNTVIKVSVSIAWNGIESNRQLIAFGFNTASWKITEQEKTSPVCHVVLLIDGTSTSSAVDLLEKTLILDPEVRLTAKEGLSHPYLSEFHDPENEQESPPYDDSFESLQLDVSEWKSLIHMEIMTFDPDNPRQTAT
ncbi:hypothetical protein NFI96_010627 [Prochilodus magdalenae]|nr:hypothetical protein NFI96_010627 [Prochilodus magdalenae]